MKSTVVARRRRFGVPLERVRAALGLTHVDMTTLCGCGRMTYYRWERGQVQPPAWLADALDYGAAAYVAFLDGSEAANVERRLIRAALRKWYDAEGEPRSAPHPRAALIAGLNRHRTKGP